MTAVASKTYEFFADSGIFAEVSKSSNSDIWEVTVSISSKNNSIKDYVVIDVTRFSSLEDALDYLHDCDPTFHSDPFKSLELAYNRLNLSRITSGSIFAQMY